MSVLDSSKYQVSEGVIFIVPGEPQLPSVQEKEVVEEEDSETTSPRKKALRARGLMFSPSRRNLRARKGKELANSRRPDPRACAASSLGVRAQNCVPALPCGDHETCVGGVRHRLAATLGGRPCKGREHSRGDGLRGGVDLANRTALDSRRGEPSREHQVGVMFKDFRMGRSSAVFVGGPKRRRPRAERFSPPLNSLTAGPSTRRSHQSAHSTDPRPATSDFEMKSSEGKQAKQRQCLKEKRRRRRAETSAGERGKGVRISDSEARRQIKEWLRESAGTKADVPPATAHGVGEHLVETSSYVATNLRSDVYKALQAIKANGRGDLISSERLRATLCRVGQPLLPSEMDELLREADPGETGYISCSRFSRLVASSRLAPLAIGATYREEDDVVLATKAKRLARIKRLERTAAIAQAGRSGE